MFVCISLSFPELFSVSKDKAVHIMDVEAGKLVTRIPKAHRYQLGPLKLIWSIAFLKVGCSKSEYKEFLIYTGPHNKVV